ncbi:ATP-binding protein [Microlunatus sp. GCM10028923]|uniref:HAMP domain-containing sensor histidine kinase n=1 Tax=Microlunatus sp. GCM10028923 TaxID=3273400 RepID=UPI00361A124A
MTGLRTGSLQVRVAVSVIAVLVAVLVGLGLVIDTIFGIQSERGLDALLTGRAQLARQLARTGVRPQQLVNRVEADGVRARLVLSDGREFGSGVELAEQPGPTKATTTKLAGPGRLDGATVTLAVDLAVVADARSVLRQVLLITGAAAILISAALVIIAVRLSLAPLGSMARLARTIAGGRRGSRLEPTQPETELGRTATAFDAMLDELEGAEVRARQAEERSKEFLADAAHELRTPLAGILAAAESLLHYQDQLSPAERQRLEVLLVGEANRASGLVDDLLAAARLDAGVDLNRTDLDVAALVEDEVSRERALHPALTLITEGPPTSAYLDGDKLSGILRNLLGNAIRAVGDQGTILITVEPAGDRVLVAVEDDGPGVPPADRERIFERLVRLDAGRSTLSGGSGLGLAIARGYARAHGGELVCVDPVRLPGARFLLTLPVRDL